MKPDSLPPYLLSDENKQADKTQRAGDAEGRVVLLTLARCGLGESIFQGQGLLICRSSTINSSVRSFLALNVLFCMADSIKGSTERGAPLGTLANCLGMGAGPDQALKKKGGA